MEPGDGNGYGDEDGGRNWDVRMEEDGARDPHGLGTRELAQTAVTGDDGRRWEFEHGQVGRVVVTGCAVGDLDLRTCP